MGNRQHRRRDAPTALEQAADRAMLAYESVARSLDIEVSTIIVIGVDAEGKANISMSLDKAVDPDEAVKGACVAYFEGRGRNVAILDQFPRR